MNAPRDASCEGTLLHMLKDPAEAAAYVEAVMELDDPAALLVALRHVARAHGMAEVARRANMGDKTGPGGYTVQNHVLAAA
jgi:DNA-binding phage protein